MSCIRFSTPAQRRQMQESAPAMPTVERAAAPVPPVTESKIRRLRLLSTDANPKIRESAASSYHAPDEVFAALAADPNEGVRACVARNALVPGEVLRSLAQDDCDTVRGWLVLNASTPSDVAESLANDLSATVRRLAAWKMAIMAG